MTNNELSGIYPSNHVVHAGSDNIGQSASNPDEAVWSPAYTNRSLDASSVPGFEIPVSPSLSPKATLAIER